MLRSLGIAAALAATVGMAVPAEAQWRGGGGRWHHRDRIDGGDVLLGALLVGGVVAVASAASSASRQRQLPPEAPLPPEWDDPDGPDGSFGGNEYDDDGFGDDAPVAAADEDAAADRCSAAAEAEGRRLARRAVVSEVTDVDRAGDGWFVAGSIDLSDGYRDVGTERRFRCNIVAGQPPSVRIDGGVLARR